MGIHASPAPRPLSTAVAAVLLIAMASSAALAQGTEEERRACTPDVMRLCRPFIPSVSAITQCLIDRRAELNPDCRQVMAPPRVEPVRQAARPPTRRAAASPAASRHSAHIHATAQKPRATAARTARPSVSADPAIRPPADVGAARPARKVRMTKPAAHDAATQNPYTPSAP